MTLFCCSAIVFKYLTLILFSRDYETKEITLILNTKQTNGQSKCVTFVLVEKVYWICQWCSIIFLLLFNTRTTDYVKMNLKLKNTQNKNQNIKISCFRSSCLKFNFGNFSVKTMTCEIFLTFVPTALIWLSSVWNEWQCEVQYQFISIYFKLFHYNSLH
jgi:hypothetical protein